jgi:hypothetical protein
MTLLRAWVWGGDRFLTRPMAASFVACGVGLLLLCPFVVHGDGVVYFVFLRRLLGENQPLGVAYQFGSSFWNAPFYLVGRSLGDGEIAIGVASATAAFLTLFFAWKLLRALALPHGPVLLFAAFFGTPLWFYVYFEPSYTHAVDALLITSVMYLLLRAHLGSETPTLLLLGACLGVLPAVRYANASFAFAVLAGLPFVIPRRSALYVIGAAMSSAALVFLIPVAASIPYGGPPAALNAPGSHPSFDPWVPLKMLFSFHRGLFAWTPVTAVAAVGFVLLCTGRGEHRRPLRLVGIASVALVCVHVAWGDAWDGGFSFSARFLAGLFPVYTLGLAEVVRRRPRAGSLLALAGAAFSVFVGLNVHYGYTGQSGADGVDRIFRLYSDRERTVPGLLRGVAVDARQRVEHLVP